MTGYARAQGSDERRRWVWEARSVNGRNLEIRCRVPQGFDVKAAGVNFPDVLTVQGKYQYKPELPFTPGNEFAGVVRAVGTTPGSDSVWP